MKSRRLSFLSHKSKVQTVSNVNLVANMVSGAPPPPSSGAQDTLDTPLDLTYDIDKPIANHFSQAGHSIDTVRVKGLWLLFTDNARDRKDMESYLFEKLGSRIPKGINKKTFLKRIFLRPISLQLNCCVISIQMFSVLTTNLFCFSLFLIVTLTSCTLPF